ncbi:MAG: hypothetical protein V4450_16890 [Bacteroidota bacterium]
MRRLFFLLFLIAGMHTTYGQVYDSVDFKKIQVNGISLGTSKNLLVKKLGKPAKMVTTENTTGMDMYSEYHYFKSSLRVSVAGTLNGFDITDDHFVIGYNQLKIKNGDPIQPIAGRFPNSAKAFPKDILGNFKLKIKASNSYVILKVVNGVIRKMEVKDEQPQ